MYIIISTDFVKLHVVSSKLREE